MADEWDETPVTEWSEEPDKYSKVPQALQDRIVRGGTLNAQLRALSVAERGIEGFKRGFGSEPLGLHHGSRLDKVLREDLPIFDKHGEGVTPLRFFNEAMLSPVITGLDFFTRAMNGAAHGIGGIVGGVVKEVSGDETQAGKAEKDVATLVNIAGLVSGQAPPLVRVKRGPLSVTDEQVGGGLPRRPDFETAAKVISEGEHVPGLADKLEKLYFDHGMLPSEVAADAATIPEVKASLVARGDRLPEHYTGLDIADAADTTHGISILRASNRAWMYDTKLKRYISTRRLEDGSVVPAPGEVATYLENFGKRAGFKFQVGPEQTAPTGGGSGAFYAGSAKVVDGKRGRQEGFVYLPDTPDELSRRWWGLGRAEIAHHEVGHALDFHVLGQASRKLKPGTPLYEEVVAASKQFRPKMWEMQEKYNLKPEELMADAVAQWITDPSFRKQMPEFEKKFGKKLAPYVEIANQALPVRQGGKWEPPPDGEPFDMSSETPYTASGGGSGKLPPPPEGPPPPAVPPADAGGPLDKPATRAQKAGAKGPGGQPIDTVGGRLDEANAAVDRFINRDPAKPYTLDQFQADWINKVHALEQEGGEVKQFAGKGEKRDWLRRAIDEASGREVEQAILMAADNPGALARLYSGVAAKVDVFLSSNRGQGGPRNFFSYQRLGPALEDILKPLKGDLRNFERFITAARSAEYEKRGLTSGLDQTHAKTIVDLGKAEYGETALKLVRFQNEVAMYLRDSGVLNRDGYAAMVKANRLYVPFHRVFRLEGRTIQGVGGSLQAQNPIKKLLGSERQIEPPLESIIKNTYVMVAMAERNRIMTKLIDKMIGPETTGLKKKGGTELVTRKDGEIVPSEAPPTKFEIERIDKAPGEVDPAIIEWTKREGIEDPNINLATAIDDIAAPLNEDTIRVFRNGRAFDYRVSPELARAIKNLDQADVGVYERFLNIPASTLRAGAIVNPVFWMRHLIRDPLAASTNYMGPGTYTYADAIKGLVGAILKDQDFVNWKMSGGAHTSLVSLDRNYLQKHLNEMAADTGLFTRAWNVVADPSLSYLERGKTLAGLPLDAAKYTMDKLQATTEIVMSSVHLGAYKKVMRENEKLLRDRARQDLSMPLPGLEGEMRTALPPVTPLREQGIPAVRPEGAVGPEGIPLGTRKPGQPPPGKQTVPGQFEDVPTKDTPLKQAMLDAAYISRETSVDNARMGAKVRGINMVFAFANARIQDMARLGAAFRDRPATTTSMIMGGIVLPSILLHYASRNDDGTLDSRVRDLPQWQRDIFWIVPTSRWEPTTPEIAQTRQLAQPDRVRLGSDGVWYQDNGVLLRIPKPYGLGVVFGTGTERLLDSYFTENPDAWRGFSKAIGEAFLGEVAFPNALVPIVEQISNRRLFTGAPLIPSTMEKGLPEYQYTPYTTETAKAVGLFMSQLPGVQSARLDQTTLTGRGAEMLSSPMLLEHYVRAYTGTLGYQALQILDTGLKSAGVVSSLENPVAKTTLESIPFVSAFLARHPTAQSGQVEQFFDTATKAERLFKSWQERARKGDTEAMLRIQAEGGAFMVQRLTAVKQALTNAGKMARMINDDPKMPGEQKRQLIDNAYYSMIVMAREGMKVARDAEKAFKETR